MQFGSWVPQFFYDLIGRITPGLALLLYGSIVLHGLDGTRMEMSTWLSDPKIPYSAVLFLLLLVAYLLGLILSAVGDWVLDREWKVNVEAIRVRVPTNTDISSALPYVYDAIQYHDPAAGSRLAKLSAERSLCRVLVIGLGGLVLFHCATNAPYEIAFWSVAALGVVGIAGSLAFHRHLRIRSLRLMVDTWHLIVADKGRKAAGLEGIVNAEAGS